MDELGACGLLGVCERHRVLKKTRKFDDTRFNLFRKREGSQFKAATFELSFGEYEKQDALMGIMGII